MTDDPGTRLIMALRQLNSELSTNNRVVAKQTGLNPADLAILDAVHREGPQSATALARRTRTHLATMTGILTRLERDGWIGRRPDSSDKRAVVIESASTERLTEIYAPVNRELAALVAELPADRLAFLTDFLDRASATIRDANAGTP